MCCFGHLFTCHAVTDLLFLPDTTTVTVICFYKSVFFLSRYIMLHNMLNTWSKGSWDWVNSFSFLFCLKFSHGMITIGCHWTLSQNICIKLSFSQLSPVASLESFCLCLAQCGLLSAYVRFSLTMNGRCWCTSDLSLVILLHQSHIPELIN